LEGTLVPNRAKRKRPPTRSYGGIFHHGGVSGQGRKVSENAGGVALRKPSLRRGAEHLRRLRPTWGWQKTGPARPERWSSPDFRRS